jgi:hypothetical protein
MLETIFIVVSLLVIAGVLLWFMNRSMDQDRLRGHLETRGSKLLDLQMLAVGRDWWARSLERSYEVRYLDADGHEHLATCKTGLFKGVNWTDDKFIRYADQVEGTPLPGKTDLQG